MAGTGRERRPAERLGDVHPGVGVNALALNLGSDQFEPAIEAMIRDGTLTLSRADSVAVENSRPEELPARSIESVVVKQKRLTSGQLADGLRYFTGTTVWFHHALMPWPGK